MEEDSQATLSQMAAAKDIAILVAGDPLMATTHKMLLHRGEEGRASKQV